MTRKIILSETKYVNCISGNEILNFIAEYYQDKYPNLRLGQAFLNELFPDVSHPELYYSEDDKVSISLMWEYYMDCGDSNSSLEEESKKWKKE